MKEFHKAWAHDELAADLAGHLKAPDRMVWCDMQLGPVGSPRPDVYAINKSYVHPYPSAYECKISVSDFRSDVTSGKWSTYLQYAYRLFFCVPVGIVSKSEVPDMCGLMVRHEKAWRIAKKPVVNPVTIPQAALLKLLIDGVHREGPLARAEMWHSNVDQFSKKFGATAARYVADATAIHSELERAERQRLKMHEDAREQVARIKERTMEEMPAKWAELLSILGLDPNASIWDVRREIAVIRDAKDGSEEARELRSVLGMLRRIVDQLKRFEEIAPLKATDSGQDALKPTQ